ncbi:hypothetical protein D9M71_608850 [compost metagenome]
MTFHVMHAKGRNAPGKGQRLGTGSPDQQRPHQARTRGVGDCVDLRRHAAGLSQDLADQRQHTLDVISRGQLRHHATIGAVQVDLTEQCVGQQATFTVV